MMAVRVRAQGRLGGHRSESPSGLVTLNLLAGACLARPVLHGGSSRATRPSSWKKPCSGGAFPSERRSPNGVGLLANAMKMVSQLL